MVLLSSRVKSSEDEPRRPTATWGSVTGRLRLLRTSSKNKNFTTLALNLTLVDSLAPSTLALVKRI